jgi:light-regulated signal transduction histidine kinase (bacteriophytochrome)
MYTNPVNPKIKKILIQTIYDILGAHDGKVKVETKEGEGSEFIIQLPMV